ncbi:MAG: hypothetical protein IPM82_14465 [Saprospiraceae bacterium]|nr:hypothetical protein [Saprospiraceae bacterium]
MISIHHYGHDSSTLAIGAIDLSKIYEDSSSELPIEIEPFTISLETDDATLEKSFDNIKTYLQDIISFSLAQIASEINP